jgi:hypothetical protein
MKEYREFKTFFRQWKKNKCRVHNGNIILIPAKTNTRVTSLEMKMYSCYPEGKPESVSVVFSFSQSPRIAFGQSIPLQGYVGYRNYEEVELGKKILIKLHSLMPIFDSFTDRQISNCIFPIVNYFVDLPKDILNIILDYVCISRDV